MTHKQDDDELLTEQDAADWLYYTPKSLYHWRKGYSNPPNGKVLPFIMKGRIAYYKLKDLRNFVIKQE